MQNVYKFREKIANMQNALTEAKKCAKLAAKYNDAPDPEQINWFLS